MSSLFVWHSCYTHILKLWKCNQLKKKHCILELPLIISAYVYTSRSQILFPPLLPWNKIPLHCDCFIQKHFYFQEVCIYLDKYRKVLRDCVGFCEGELFCLDTDMQGPQVEQTHGHWSKGNVQPCAERPWHRIRKHLVAICSSPRIALTSKLFCYDSHSYL